MYFLKTLCHIKQRFYIRKTYFGNALEFLELPRRNRPSSNYTILQYSSNVKHPIKRVYLQFCLKITIILLLIYLSWCTNRPRSNNVYNVFYCNIMILKSIKHQTLFERGLDSCFKVVVIVQRIFNLHSLLI